MWQVERSRLPTQEELLRCVKLKADVKSKLEKKKKKRRSKTFKSLLTDDARLIRNVGSCLSYYYQKRAKECKTDKRVRLGMGK